MYTLGIPDRQKRRTLGYLKQQWIEFEESPSMGGFFNLSFPELDEEGFRNIAVKLKRQGVSILGADEQLTERKIMKLTDLITEIPNLDETYDMKILGELKRILKVWNTKAYASDKDRWEEYYLDIEELVEDVEENETMNTPSPSQLANLSEQMLRKLIRKTIRE